MINTLIHIVSVVAALAVFYHIRSDIKRLLPVGLFASVYSNLINTFGVTLGWWEYRDGLFFFSEIKDTTLDFFVAPALAMLFMKYVQPKNLWLMALAGTVFGGGIEYILERYTDIIKHKNGWNIWHSSALWFISWPIWYKFGKWWEGFK